jgi:hypothetical protein
MRRRKQLLGELNETRGYWKLKEEALDHTAWRTRFDELYIYIYLNPVIMTSVVQHLAYSVRYSVVPINSSVLTIILYASVIKTLVYNNTKYSVPFMTL